MRWPWSIRQASVLTSDGGAAAAGLCERCNSVAIVWLNGRRLLCWDHYCEEMQRMCTIRPLRSE